MFAHFWVHTFVLAALVVMLIAIAAVDFRHFKIPNRFVIAVALLYPLHVLSSPNPVHWDYGLASGVIMFVIGAFFFAAKMMGGGDVKALTVVSMWAAPLYLMEFLIVTLAGAVVLAFVMAGRYAFDGARAQGGSIGTAILNFRHVPILKMSVPYGVGVAAGGLYVVGRLFAG